MPQNGGAERPIEFVGDRRVPRSGQAVVVVEAVLGVVFQVVLGVVVEAVPEVVLPDDAAPWCRPPGPCP